MGIVIPGLNFDLKDSFQRVLFNSSYAPAQNDNDILPPPANYERTITEQTAEAPKAHLKIIKGFKSPPMYYRPFAERVADESGFSTHVMGFQSPGTRMDFLDSYRTSAYKFFSSESPDNTPEIIGAHSLGAFLLLELLAEEETAEIIADRCEGIIMANPYLGNQYHDRRACRLFSQISAVADQPTGTTRVEKGLSQIVTTAKKIIGKKALARTFHEGSNSIHELPTHRQGLFLHQEAKHLVKQIEANGLAPAARDIPMLFVTGAKDTVCKNARIERLADILGAEHQEFDTGHNVFLEGSEGASACVDWWKNHITEAEPKQKQALLPVMLPWLHLATQRTPS